LPWRDRSIGIVLGLILGVGIVTAFVFVYSEQTVDAPSISNPGKGGRGGARAGSSSTPPVAEVRVIDGTPPAGGPAELHYRKGDLVRLRVVSDATQAVELLGYGISRTVPAGSPTLIRFRASRPGNFPLVVTTSHIDVARITVAEPAL
jgi:hypothetical protein